MGEWEFGAIDQETYDRLIAEGKSERIARSKAKAAAARGDAPSRRGIATADRGIAVGAVVPYPSGSVLHPESWGVDPEVLAAEDPTSTALWELTDLLAQLSGSGATEEVREEAARLQSDLSEDPLLRARFADRRLRDRFRVRWLRMVEESTPETRAAWLRPEPDPDVPELVFVDVGASPKWPEPFASDPTWVAWSERWLQRRARHAWLRRDSWSVRLVTAVSQLLRRGGVSHLRALRTGLMPLAAIELHLLARTRWEQDRAENALRLREFEDIMRSRARPALHPELMAREQERMLREGSELVGRANELGVTQEEWDEARRSGRTLSIFGLALADDAQVKREAEHETTFRDAVEALRKDLLADDDPVTQDPGPNVRLQRREPRLENLLRRVRETLPLATGPRSLLPGHIVVADDHLIVRGNITGMVLAILDRGLLVRRFDPGSTPTDLHATPDPRAHTGVAGELAALGLYESDAVLIPWGARSKLSPQEGTVPVSDLYAHPERLVTKGLGTAKPGTQGFPLRLQRWTDPGDSEPSLSALWLPFWFANGRLHLAQRYSLDSLDLGAVDSAWPRTARIVGLCVPTTQEWNTFAQQLDRQRGRFGWTAARRDAVVASCEDAVRDALKVDLEEWGAARADERVLNVVSIGESLDLHVTTLVATDCAFAFATNRRQHDETEEPEAANGSTTDPEVFPWPLIRRIDAEAHRLVLRRVRGDWDYLTLWPEDSSVVDREGVKRALASLLAAASRRCNEAPAGNKQAREQARVGSGTSVRDGSRALAAGAVITHDDGSKTLITVAVTDTGLVFHRTYKHAGPDLRAGGYTSDGLELIPWRAIATIRPGRQRRDLVITRLTDEGPRDEITVQAVDAQEADRFLAAARDRVPDAASRARDLDEAVRRAQSQARIDSGSDKRDWEEAVASGRVVTVTHAMGRTVDIDGQRVAARLRITTAAATDAGLVTHSTVWDATKGPDPRHGSYTQGEAELMPWRSIGSIRRTAMTVTIESLTGRTIRIDIANAPRIDADDPNLTDGELVTDSEAIARTVPLFVEAAQRKIAATH